jgi:hypothetical protein
MYIDTFLSHFCRPFGTVYAAEAGGMSLKALEVEITS